MWSPESTFLTTTLYLSGLGCHEKCRHFVNLPLQAVVFTHCFGHKHCLPTLASTPGFAFQQIRRDRSRQSSGLSVGRVPQRPPHVRWPRPLHPKPCWPGAKSDDPSAEARLPSPSSCATRGTVVPHRLDLGPRESTGWGAQAAAPSCAQDHLLCRPL